ncbi:MAG: DUF2637 domain-containing protein, partial [Nocardioides sp.]
MVAGLAVVASTAVIASFSTLAELARTAGWGPRTSWLLPGCVDALAMSAGRVWLSPTATDRARRYARGVTLTAIAASVTGNAVGHLTSTGRITLDGDAGIMLVILVGAVPAVALGAVGHLATLAGTPVTTRRAPRASSASSTSGTAGTAARETGRAPAGTSSAGTRGTGTPKAGTPRGGAAPGAGTTAIGGDSRTSRRDQPGASAKRDKARAVWDTERAAGRTPTGTELAAVAG